MNTEQIQVVIDTLEIKADDEIDVWTTGDDPFHGAYAFRSSNVLFLTGYGAEFAIPIQAITAIKVAK